MPDNDVVSEILDTARYLRKVRPLDPSELQVYISTDVESRSIRQVLREHAVQLGVYERSDGTFVPVSDDTVPPICETIQSVPEQIVHEITQILTSEYDEQWYSGASGDRIRQAIRSFKSAYFEGSRVEYDRETAIGYAIYHLPGTFAKIQYVLAELGNANLIPPSVRVLEIGPGVGGAALGLHSYLGPDWPISYHGIEPSASAATLCSEFLSTCERNVQFEIENEAIESVSLTESYDLIILANVLTELEAPLQVLDQVLPHLAEDGSIIAISPADERTSRGLREIERKTLERHRDVDVYAPTLRLWPEFQPLDACWSFDVKPSLETPSFQRALDEGKRESQDTRDPATGEFVNTEIRYSFSLLRTDGKRSNPIRLRRSRVAPLRDTADHVGDRLNLTVVKLSHSLADDGRPLYVIGDGSQQEEHFAVHTNRTSLNDALATAEYGDVLTIESGLLLWNDEQSSYNVVIDDQALVDVLPSA